MSFTSASFLVFLTLFAIVWPWSRHDRQTRWLTLTAFSFFFYGYWDWRFLFLLIGTGLIDFWAALALMRPGARKKLLLTLSLGANLGVLGFFKYAGFFAQQTHGLAGWPSAGAVDWARTIILPVGISFYTFQSMSYTIDVYRGQLKPTRSLPHFCAYLSLFPQLVAGPIIRAADLLPQLEHPGDFTAANRWRGLERIALGFFKKLVIADNAAPFVNEVFGTIDPTGTGGAIWWLAALFFALQIYCDFSGYSDIAIGLASWMGYSFPENFTRPYSALGFREFWARWHISLSTWFRDYVYIPLGGNRGGRFHQHLVLWVTLLASGLWHGANWTFLTWGAAHAALLSLERLTAWPKQIVRLPAGRKLGFALTFLLVLLTWILFRAETLTQALSVLRQMLTHPVGGLSAALGHLHAGHLLALASFLGLALVPTLHARPAWTVRLGRPLVRFAAVVCAILAAIFLRGTGHEFIYFKF
jgi:alginate O-acetyltransferase complex protein AlgI